VCVGVCTCVTIHIEIQFLILHLEYAFYNALLQLLLLGRCQGVGVGRCVCV